MLHEPSKSTLTTQQMLMWIATATDAVRSKLPLPSGLVVCAAGRDGDVDGEPNAESRLEDDAQPVLVSGHDDAAVASERKERPCHGCVWAADADLERKLLLQEVDRRA